MPDLITDHVWRSRATSHAVPGGAAAVPECGFMNCGRPRSEHAEDWSRFQKCPVCGASLGEPCVTRAAVEMQTGRAIHIGGPERAEPHTGRKLRAESARTGGNQ